MNPLEQIYHLDSVGDVDGALDILYDHVDDNFQLSEFGKCDFLLKNIELDRVSITILVGFLAATLPAKDLLKSRHLFVINVESELNKRLTDKQRIEKILKGLR